jgi:hypothetical protein
MLDLIGMIVLAAVIALSISLLVNTMPLSAAARLAVPTVAMHGPAWRLRSLLPGHLRIPVCHFP